jgi:hypothetical protein
MKIHNIELIPDVNDTIQYQTAMWKFDVLNDVDLKPHLLDASFVPLNSTLTIDNQRQCYKEGTSEILDDLITRTNNMFFQIFKTLAFSKELDRNWNNIFQARWPVNEEKFDKNFFIKTQIFNDGPGFSMGKHLDNQRVVGNALINLVDNTASTNFFNYKNQNEIIFSFPGNKNTGIIFFNTPATLHNIVNQGNRYIINPSLMISRWW